MNPSAIRHYLHWLRHKWSPQPFYAAISAIVALGVSFLARLGHSSAPRAGIGTQIIGLLIALGAGALMASAIYIGTRLGSWTLLTRLEAGSDRLYRVVWYELMTKYRGLRPDVIDSARFRQLLLRLCSEIVRNEELTPEQQLWMSDLMSLAEEKPKSAAKSLASAFASKYGRQTIVVTMGFVVVTSLVRLIALWLRK
jgi:hypothetical protein